MTLGTERSHNLHVVGGCNNSNNNNKLLSASLTQYLLMVHFGSPCRTSIAVQNVSRILSSVSEDLHPEQTANLEFRVTTCLENLEMSGNLTAVREVSGILLKFREMSEKYLVREKLPKTVYCKLHIYVHTGYCYYYY